MSEIKVINARLTELNKEFSDLSKLKKELIAKEEQESLAERLKEFNFLVKTTSYDAIDAEKVVTYKNAKIIKGDFGFPVFIYEEVDGSTEAFGLAVSPGEAEDRILAYQLSQVAGFLAKQKDLTPDDIIRTYNEVLDGRRLSEEK